MDNKKRTNNEQSDSEIINLILLEKDNDIATRDKLYKLLYQASEEDEFNMDTDLIKECVDTINLIEGDEEQISDEKIITMRQNIELQYKKGDRAARRKHFLRTVSITAVSILLILSLTNVVAYSFGYNIIEIVSNWGADNFNLFTGHKSEIPENNLANRVIDISIKEAFADIEQKPLLPAWLPEGYSYVEFYVDNDGGSESKAVTSTPKTAE